jgi:uncharacterized protein YidB (DUF937 family)
MFIKTPRFRIPGLLSIITLLRQFGCAIENCRETLRSSFIPAVRLKSPKFAGDNHMAIDWAGIINGAIGELEKHPELISQALQKTGGLQGVLDKLHQAGLDKEVESWISNGRNLPVTADQLRSALNDKQLQQIARSMGLPVDQALEVIAKYLPQAVDQASPDGKLATK